ncbi:MAG: S8 family serine peptidase [Pseudomonadales bacterium]
MSKVVLFLSGLLLLPTLGNAQNIYQQAWEQPLQVELPAPTRSIVLRRGVEVAGWLKEHGLADASVTRIGQQTLVQTRMDDAAWSQVEPDACRHAGVAACETASCQAIQLQSQIAGVKQSEKLKARIVPKQRTLAVPAADDEANMCRAPAPGGFNESTQSGEQLVLEIPDLELGERRSSTARSQAETATAEPATSELATTDPAAAELADEQPPADYEAPAEAAAQGARSFTLNMNAFGTQPGFSAQNLPADTSDYDLLIGEGCREVRIPLDSVEPAYVEGRIVAVVAAGDVNAVASSYGLSVVEATTLASTGDNLVVFSGAADVLSTLALLALDSRISASQKEYVYTTTASGTSYSDTYAALSYGPRVTGALQLHAATQGADQTVAVIDTGVALEHPDLVGRVDATDFTGQGFTPDAHGTAVAGIIAAAANNAVGTYGVAPATRIHAYKACQPVVEGELAAKCWSSTLVKALDAALLAEAKVINMSLAGPPDPLLEKYIAAAVAKDVLVVAGAGNGGMHARAAFPAALEGVIAVTAVDALNRLYAQANVGGYIDLAAPGVDIITPSPGENYPSSSGTSWAAAHVSGVAVLLKDLVPFIGANEVAGLLSASATDLGAPGSDEQFGSGLVNACQAAGNATADAVGCGEINEQ